MTKTIHNIHRNRWFYLCQLIIDVVLVVMSYYIGFRLQRPEIFNTLFPISVVVTLVYISVIAFIVFIMLKTYKCGEKTYYSTMFYIIVGLIIIMLSAVFTDFAIKGIGVWRRTISYALSIEIICFLIIKFIFYKLHKVIIKKRPCFIVGKDKVDLQELLLKFSQGTNNVYIIKTLVMDTSPKLLLYVDSGEYEKVIVSSTCDDDIKKKLIEYCAISGVDCTIVPNHYDIIINGGKIASVENTMMLNMNVKLDVETRMIKRSIDIIFSSILLIVLLPVILLSAILIKVQDGGNPLFRQERITKDNKKFILYKFRTMIEDAEKETGAVLAKVNDTRITKLGNFMRKFRIDEIPQLLNVFKGDMSLVGPRPERQKLIDEITQDIPEFRYRTLVKAGLTGLAQTMGRYDIAFSDKLLFDLYYVNNYSILFDIKIIFNTLHTLTRPSVATGLATHISIEDKLKNNGYTFTDCDGDIAVRLP